MNTIKHVKIRHNSLLCMARCLLPRLENLSQTRLPFEHRCRLLCPDPFQIVLLRYQIRQRRQLLLGLNAGQQKIVENMDLWL